MRYLKMEVRNKEKSFISIVVYTYNVEIHITNFLKFLWKIMSEHFEKFEIICVDDASDDQTIEGIKEFTKTEGLKGKCIVTIIHMGFYHGLESTMCAGVDLAIGDFVYEFDSTTVDYGENLPYEIYQYSMQGFDIVSAVPKKMHNVSSKIFYKIFNKYSRSQYKLNTESFRIISRRGINRVKSLSKTIPYRKALYATCGLNSKQITYDNTKILYRENIKKVKDSRNKIAIDALLLFTNLGYKISISLAIVMICFVFGTGLYTVIAYFAQNKPVEGWAPIMGLLSFGLMGIFLILSIMLKYFDLLLRLVFNRKKYLISSIEKLE